MIRVLVSWTVIENDHKLGSWNIQALILRVPRLWGPKSRYFQGLWARESRIESGSGQSYQAFAGSLGISGLRLCTSNFSLCLSLPAFCATRSSPLETSFDLSPHYSTMTSLKVLNLNTSEHLETLFPNEIALSIHRGPVHPSTTSESCAEFLLYRTKGRGMVSGIWQVPAGRKPGSCRVLPLLPTTYQAQGRQEVEIESFWSHCLEHLWPKATIIYWGFPTGALLMKNKGILLNLCIEHLSRYPKLFAKWTQISSRKRWRKSKEQ